MNDDKPKFDFSQKLPSLPPPDWKTPPSVPSLFWILTICWMLVTFCLIGIMFLNIKALENIFRYIKHHEILYFVVFFFETLFPFIITIKLVNMKDKQNTISWRTILKAVLWYIVAIFVAGIVLIGFVIASCSA